MEALLVLEDGRVHRGRSFGAIAERGGEVVFNTSMTGYQEVLTDPSYRGQIVVMTCPEIGNCGVNDLDLESRRIQVEGLVVREVSEISSSWRARKDLPQYLREHDIPAISEVDSRAITRHLRSGGVLRGIVSSLDLNSESLLRKARALPRLGEIDLVGRVTCLAASQWRGGGPVAWAGPTARARRTQRHRVVAFDFGMKENILRRLSACGCRIAVVPARTSAEEAAALSPDGFFLSNGPGDPEALGEAAATVRSLLERGLPIFGICLGHQVLARALGGRTFKLKFGHRGANHPVKNLLNGRVEITSQNHGYAVDEDTLPGDLEVTHISLNDGTIEGMRHRVLPVFSVQYHPEASPGPHDTLYLFDEFANLMEMRRSTLESGRRAPESGTSAARGDPGGSADG